MLNEVVEILNQLYLKGWDERNGGNLSYLITEEEVKELCDPNKVIRTFTYDFDMSYLIGKYFIITGTGTYFR